MNFKFDNNLESFLKIILNSAQKQNKKVYFVGGIVRDYFLNKKTADIDILLDGNAIEFAQLLPKNLSIKSIHKDFCTVKIKYKNSEIDIASTRTENYPHSGCLPIVQQIGVGLEKDVLRRDFTVNSMYFELTLDKDKIKYKLIDLINAQQDIKEKTLRVLHPNSYIDDPTRILRGLDFKYRFNFDFSTEDKKLIIESLEKIDYQNISSDRTFQVLKKTLLNKKANSIFKEIVENKYYKILYNNTIDINLEEIDEIIKKFKLHVEELALFYLDILKNDNIEKQDFNNYFTIYKAFKNYPTHKLAYYFYKTKDENMDTFLKFEKQKLYINGDDLIKLNYPKGKLYGEIMNSLLNEKLKNKLNNIDWNKNDEIKWILKHFPQDEKK